MMTTRLARPAMAHRVFAVIALAALGGCGSNDSNSPAGGTLAVADDRPGLVVDGPADRPVDEVDLGNLVVVDIYQREGRPDFGRAYADFSIYTSGIAFSAVADFYERELDTCVIEDAPDTDTPASDRPDQIDAGDTIVFTSVAGTWLTLPRRMSNETTYYSSENDGLPSLLPDDTVLDVPGGSIFPSVSDIRVQGVATIERQEPARGETITADTVYRWNAGDPAGFVRLVFYTVLDGTSSDTLVTCEVGDDGLFVPPQEIIADLIGRGAGLTLYFERVAARLEYRDNLAIFVESSIADL